AQYFPDQAKQLAALYQSNPQAFHQQIDQAVLASPKQQQLASERTTAQARQSQAATTSAHDKVTESQGAQRLQQEADAATFNKAARTQELSQGAQRLGIENARHKNEQTYPPTGPAGLKGKNFLNPFNPRTAIIVKPPAAGNFAWP